MPLTVHGRRDAYTGRHTVATCWVTAPCCTGGKQLSRDVAKTTKIPVGRSTRREANDVAWLPGGMRGFHAGSSGRPAGCRRAPARAVVARLRGALPAHETATWCGRHEDRPHGYHHATRQRARGRAGAWAGAGLCRPGYAAVRLRDTRACASIGTTSWSPAVEQWYLNRRLIASSVGPGPKMARVPFDGPGPPSPAHALC